MPTRPKVLVVLLRFQDVAPGAALELVGPVVGPEVDPEVDPEVALEAGLEVALEEVPKAKRVA